VSIADRFRSLRMDVTPLRESRDFRLLFTAGTIFYLGAMMTYVAVPFSLYHLTGSNFAVGVVGLVELVPLIVFGLYGGALADHADRRRILIVCGATEALLTVVLAVNALSEHPRVWLIYVVAGLLACTTGLRRPSKEALLPRTVRHEQIAAANALDSFGTQAGVLVGPAIGGLLLAHAGPAWCFGANAVALLVAVLLFALLRPYPHVGETEAPSLRGIREGISYAMGRKDLLGTYLVDIAAMLLAMPVVIFPALATEVFDRPELLGLLYSAETIGAVVATALSGWTARVHHHGRAIVVAASIYGACIALAGAAPGIWLCMAFLAAAGGADMISAVFRSTVWNQTIPDNMRGRLAGIEMLSYSVGPMGGDVRAGFVADAWSVRGSFVSGGVACVAGVALTAAWLRDFWTYDARTDPHAVAERERRAGQADPAAT
jgi:MFS family permease